MYYNKDGFINAPKLAKYKEKETKKFLILKGTKEKIKKIEKKKKLMKNELIKKEN